MLVHGDDFGVAQAAASTGRWLFFAFAQDSKDRSAKLDAMKKKFPKPYAELIAIFERLEKGEIISDRTHAAGLGLSTSVACSHAVTSAPRSPACAPPARWRTSGKSAPAWGSSASSGRR